jgi:hypothetical protein
VRESVRSLQPLSEIAHSLGITVASLERHFEKEIKEGKNDLARKCSQRFYEYLELEATDRSGRTLCNPIVLKENQAKLAAKYLAQTQDTKQVHHLLLPRIVPVVLPETTEETNN